MRLPSVAILLALLLGSCADDNVSVFITGMAIPSAGDGSCSYEPSTTTLGAGIYDPSRGNGYFLFAIVENALKPRENEFRPETNGVFITDAIVNIVDTTSGGSIDEYRVPASGYIPPGSQAVVAIEAITATAGGGLTSQVILEISLIGQTQGEIDIETGTFSWPVTVCSGCLFPPCSTEETTSDSLGACSPGSNFQLVEACPAP